MVKLYRLIVVALALALAACGGGGFGASADDDGSSPVPAQHRQPTEPEPEIPGGPGPTIPPATSSAASICYLCCIESGAPIWVCRGDEGPGDDDDDGGGGGYDWDEDCWWDPACHYYGDCCDG